MGQSRECLVRSRRASEPDEWDSEGFRSALQRLAHKTHGDMSFLLFSTFSSHSLSARDKYAGGLGSTTNDFMTIPHHLILDLLPNTLYYQTKAGLSWPKSNMNGGNPMWKEFREFAMKGNVVDLAIGVVIGGAFSKIVTSLVNDLIMPLVSLLTGKVDFSNLFFALDGNIYQTLEEAKAAGAATLNYGSFITTIVDFVIIAFALFITVKQVNKLRSIAVPAPATEEPAPPTTNTCPFCQSEISIKAVKCPHCTSDLE